MITQKFYKLKKYSKKDLKLMVASSCHQQRRQNYKTEHLKTR